MLIFILLFFAVIATDITLIDKAPVSIVVGSQEFGPVAIADSAVEITAQLSRRTLTTLTTWADPSTIIKGEIFLSFDGGASFQLLCGFTANGGEHIRPDTTISPETTINCPLPKRAGKQVKGVLTLMSGLPAATDFTIITK